MNGRRPPDKFDLVVWRAGFIAFLMAVIIGLAMIVFPFTTREVLTRQQAAGVIIVIPSIMTAWFLAKDHEFSRGE